MPDQPNLNLKEKKEKRGLWQAVSLAWELGYTIAIPLVILALIGRFLDKKFDSSPWLFLTGIILAFFLSTIAVYLKTSKIISQFDENKKSKIKNNS